jgi:hypothetical protein
MAIGTIRDYLVFFSLSGPGNQAGGAMGTWENIYNPCPGWKPTYKLCYYSVLSENSLSEKLQVIKSSNQKFGMHKSQHRNTRKMKNKATQFLQNLAIPQYKSNDSEVNKMSEKVFKKWL